MTRRYSGATSSTRRYRADGPWTAIAHETARRFDDGPPTRFVIECADAVDTKAGYRYVDGARRVRLAEGTAPGFRARTFFGEMAWCAAEAYAHDAAIALERSTWEVAR